MPHCAVVANSGGLVATARRRCCSMRACLGHHRPSQAGLREPTAVLCCYAPPAPLPHRRQAPRHRRRPPLLPAAIPRRRRTARLNKGKVRGLSAEIMTQLNSVVYYGLIQENLRGLDAIVFFLYAFNLAKTLEHRSKLWRIQK